MRLEGSNPDGPFLCELAPSILIIIRVKRGSSLSLIALADMARGKAKTDPKNSAKQQRYSHCWRHPPHTHTHTHARTHTHTVSCLTIKSNLKHWTISGGDFTQKISTSNSVCSTLQTHNRIEEMQTNTRPHTHAHEYT